MTPRPDHLRDCLGYLMTALSVLEPARGCVAYAGVRNPTRYHEDALREMVWRNPTEGTAHAALADYLHEQGRSEEAALHEHARDYGFPMSRDGLFAHGHTDVHGNLLDREGKPVVRWHFHGGSPGSWWAYPMTPVYSPTRWRDGTPGWEWDVTRGRHPADVGRRFTDRRELNAHLGYHPDDDESANAHFRPGNRLAPVDDAELHELSEGRFGKPADPPAPTPNPDGTDEFGNPRGYSRYADGPTPPRPLPDWASVAPSQGDGWKITTPHGYIDYRPNNGVNEIWWVESHRRGHGSELVDLMQAAHPASVVGWGVTTPSGKRLRDRWHAANPHVEMDNGAFEGQYDPSGDNYGEDVPPDEFGEGDDDPFEDYP